ncbi:hypothetical protein DFP73DRAFT_632888 [Morchella snyderi]|nr:hypothetical protein DFP73DRAFT_632888 [Morchella snyderi]
MDLFIQEGVDISVLGGAEMAKKEGNWVAVEKFVAQARGIESSIFLREEWIIIRNLNDVAPHVTGSMVPSVGVTTGDLDFHKNPTRTHKKHRINISTTESSFPRLNSRSTAMNSKVRTSQLVSLPTELLVEITKDLPLATLCSLHLTCRRFYPLLIDRIADKIPQHAQHVMRWSLWRNKPKHLTRALAAGGLFHKHYMLIIIKQDLAELLRAVFAVRAGGSQSNSSRYNAFVSPMRPARLGCEHRLLFSTELPPLHLAAEQGAVGCVRVLLAAGAEPNELDADHYTALDYALRGGFVEVVEVLLDGGAYTRGGRVVVGRERRDRLGGVRATWGGEVL